jgi:hypothetical protein
MRLACLEEIRTHIDRLRQGIEIQSCQTGQSIGFAGASSIFNECVVDWLGNGNIPRGVGRARFHEDCAEKSLGVASIEEHLRSYTIGTGTFSPSEELRSLGEG